jgi:Asp-tRNA(Asn)/Glu-tRNA(Gln) amidotransferase A subunit family amidase
MRILMGTYALSAGYYDAYYKRAQQVIAEPWHPIQYLYLIIFTT